MKKITFLIVLLFGIITQKSNAQSTTAFNVYGATYYLGYDAANPGPLNFATSTAPQMTLTTAGNLNIVGTSNGYQIGGQRVLWYNNSNSNMYVGVGAGTLGLGSNNTAIENNTVYNNTIVS